MPLLLLLRLLLGCITLSTSACHRPTDLEVLLGYPIENPVKAGVRSSSAPDTIDGVPELLPPVVK